MPHLTRLLGPALAAAVLVGGAARAEDTPFQLLSVEEVAALVGQTGARIYDANTRKTFEANRIPGATFVSYKDVSEKDLPADRTTKLVFYCKNPG